MGSELEKLIWMFIAENFGTAEADDPSYNIQALAKYIKENYKGEENDEFRKKPLQKITMGKSYNIDPHQMRADLDTIAHKLNEIIDRLNHIERKGESNE